MREQLEARLAELEQEYQIGELRLRDVDLQQARLRETLLRMSGAIQVLHELLDPPGDTGVPDPSGAETASHNGREQPPVATDPTTIAQT